MKSILKIFSSLLLSITFFFGFTGVANAYPYPACDLVSDYFCPPEILELYDAELVDLPSNDVVVVDIAPFESGVPYMVNYDLGAGREVEEYIDIVTIEVPTGDVDGELGFVQNISDNGNIIDVTISKKY